MTFINKLTKSLILLSPLITASAETPLANKSFKEIIAGYTFVDDFSVKEETRPISKNEVFWRYYITLPPRQFKIAYELTRDEIPGSLGSGRATTMLNNGRLLFLEGQYSEATKQWLEVRKEFGPKHEYHRRLDYFLGMSHLNAAFRVHKKERLSFFLDVNNGQTFLSYAFELKKDGDDPFMDTVTAKGYYNLAAIYHNAGRYAAAYGAATEGLNFLRKTGRREYRVELLQILSEAYIQNGSYLNALQELDAALRSEIAPEKAAEIFARVGDIYFSLNNFELAEENYALAAAINHQFDHLNASYFVMRGESLFWLKRFDEAKKMFHFALNTVSNSNDDDEDLPYALAAMASLRTADAWLAQGDYDKLREHKAKFEAAEKIRNNSRDAEKKYQSASEEYEKVKQPFEKAKVAYFQHYSDFRTHDRENTVEYAQIRLACLELPEYAGNNIAHARNLLHQLRTEGPKDKPADSQYSQENFSLADNPVPGAKSAVGRAVSGAVKKTPMSANPAINPEALHLAWACEVGSYVQHDRTPAMLEKVREFAKAHPTSRFLADMAESVRSVDAHSLDEYLAANQYYEAVDYFEKNRAALFKNIDNDLKRRLFEIYTDLMRPEKAVEFYDAYEKSATDDRSLIRLAVVTTEMADHKEYKDKWTKISKKLGNRLMKHQWTIEKELSTKLYLERIMNTVARYDHMPWMMELGRHWASKENKEISTLCEMIYPIAAQMFDAPDQVAMKPEEVRANAIAIIDEYLVEALQFETYCGYSILQFESRLFKADPETLAKRILARDYLTVNPTTANLIWSLSEAVLAKGDIDGARKLWLYLKTKGTDDIPEVRFAKNRLDTGQTEFEDLWRH